MIVSAPITDAAEHAAQADRAVADHDDRTARRVTPAETAACQPVGITSDSASSDGIRAGSGTPSVATRLPSAWPTRAYSP